LKKGKPDEILVYFQLAQHNITCKTIDQHLQEQALFVLMTKNYSNKNL
jgi:hypothetical protein